MGGNNSRAAVAGNSSANSQSVQSPQVDETQDTQEQVQAKQKKQALLKQVSLTKMNAYERIEARLPLQIIDIREFEGRVKKLIFDKESISIRQLQYVFSRDYEDFDDLNNEESMLYKVITSDFFKDKVNEDEVNIQFLMLFGLLYCQGSNDEKSKVFYDILQDGLQEVISANDKDLKSCFGKLLMLPTIVLHSWIMEYGDEELRGAQTESLLQRNEENEAKWESVIDEIKNTFLDDVFDVSSKIQREEFIKQCAKKQNFLFKAKEIRRKMLDKLKNL